MTFGNIGKNENINGKIGKNENINIYDFELSAEDMALIDSISGDDEQFILHHDSDNIDF